MRRYKITNQLKKQIINSKFSLDKITELCGFNVKNICYKNISINEVHFNSLAKVLNFNKENLNLKQIKFNYEKNLGKYAHSKKIYFRGKSKEFCEFLGIMLGDGNIYNNIIKITLHKKEEDYHKYIRFLFYKIFGINFHQLFTRNITNLYRCNKYLADILLKHGLKRGNKKLNNVGIPDWIFDNKIYLKSCLRGLMDTDGCVYICKRDKRLYLKFTNRSKKLLEDFKKGCKIFDINFAKGGKYNTHLYKKEEVERFINTIRFSNNKHMSKIGVMV